MDNEFSSLELDFDALGDAVGNGSPFGPRRNLPFFLEGYCTESIDPKDHYMLVRRIDTDDTTEVLRLYLTGDDPSAGTRDPMRRRPSIGDFEFPELSAAIKRNDVQSIAALAQDGRSKLFTDVGGLVFAEGLQELDCGYEARWIRPLQQDKDDPKHRVLLGWATVEKRSTSRTYEALYVKAPDAVICSTFAELQRAILSAFLDISLGRPGVFLRILQRGGDGDYHLKTVVGGNKGSGLRITRRDKRVGMSWTTPTPEEALAEFVISDVGQKLNKPSWGEGVVLEVLPFITANFGDKSLQNMAFMPDIPFAIPAGSNNNGLASQSGTPGFANATIRLTAVIPEGQAIPKFHIVSMARPLTGELYELKDLPTNHYAPAVEPYFPIYPRSERSSKNALPSSGDPLTDDFIL
jgi:hypothetical protein